jgi:hypothetical protein
MVSKTFPLNFQNMYWQIESVRFKPVVTLSNNKVFLNAVELTKLQQGHVLEALSPTYSDDFDRSLRVHTRSIWALNV